MGGWRIADVVACAACAAAFGTGASGCDATVRAQLVVVVHTDMLVPDELDAIELRVYGPDSEAPVVQRPYGVGATAADGKITLPASFGVAPRDGDVDREARIEVDAKRAETVLFTVFARSRFIEGRRLRLDLWLARSCVAGAAMCTVEETCSPTGCMPRELDPSLLPDFVPEGDPGERCVSPSTQISFGTTTARHPRVAWSGSVLGIVWLADMNMPTPLVGIQSARADASGAPIGDPDFWDTAPLGSEVDVAWSDARREFALAYNTIAPTGTAVDIARFDETGARLAEAVAIASTTGTVPYGEPSIVATPDGWAVATTAWITVGRSVVIVRTDASGMALGPPTALLDVAEGATEHPSLVWNGDGFGVAWLWRMGSSSTLDFARLDATGAVIGDIVPLTDSGALQPLAPALEWMGDGYAVTWSEGDSSSGRVMVRRVSAAGELVGPPAEVATVPFSPASPVLAWNGTGLAFTWTARDNASGVDEIKLGRLDATATTIVSEETVNDVTDTDGRGPFATSDVAWTGAGYSVAWPHGDPIGVDQIRSAHVCP